MIEIKFTSGRESLQIEAETTKKAVEQAVKDKKILIFADLRRAKLSGADLSGADLYGADLSGADLIDADLHGANLIGANLSGADLRRANLSGADLTRANLIDANLSGADLTRANLIDADLHGANLIGANLSRANLIDAYLHGADLRGAYLDYSCWPLWCGSLDVKIDKRVFCQLLYHAVRAGQSVEDEEVKEILNDHKLLTLANRFHHVDECGRIGEKIKINVK